MREIEFNLLDEPWVRVLKPEGVVEEVSLTDALLHAHEYVDLAGETPTQDVAVLRLMLAVLHTVFSRVDADGAPAPLEKVDEALQRWSALWQMQRLPEKPIRDYLNRWHERFWLFHPERPFWQVPEAAIGTEYGAAKLNGELLESGNKLRLFSSYAGIGKSELNYAQAARWLLYVNGFDDTGVKKKDEPDRKKKEVDSIKLGWLGRLGLVNAQGHTLFETLLLNLVFLPNGKELWKERERPIWERSEIRGKQCEHIVIPENAAELLTLLSRKIILIRENGKVKGYHALGGYYFDDENSFSEQMTIWSQDKPEANAPREFRPELHDSAKIIWREFPEVLDKENKTTPGVIRWIQRLQHVGSLVGREMFPNGMMQYRIVGIQYDNAQRSSVKDAFSDALTFHADLLTDLGKRWQPHITDQIEKCEKVADRLGNLAADLDMAAGGGSNGSEAKARQQFYFAVDMPFRTWLYGIDPRRDAAQDGEIVQSWVKQVKEIARRQAEEMALKAGPTAYAGRTLQKEKGSKKETRHYSTPEAYNGFIYRLNEIYKTE